MSEAVNTKNGHHKFNGHPRVVVDPTGDILLEKPLPSNPEAERLILGVIILNNPLLADVMAELKPEHFSVVSHRTIYRSMQRVASTGFEINPTTLVDDLTRSSQLDECGGPAYIANLFEGVPRFSNLDSYVRLVKQSHAERALVYAGSEIAGLGLDLDRTVSEKIARAQTLVSEIQDPQTKLQWASAGELAAQHIDNAEAFFASGRRFTGLPTGMADFDSITDGLQKTDLFVLAARPSMGKSALAACLALGAARHPDNDNPVIAYFTLEMGRDQLVNRFLSMQTRIPATLIRRGALSKEQWRSVVYAQDDLSKLRISIDDQSGITPNQLRAKCRELQRIEGRLDLIVLDYLQNMSANSPSGNLTADITTVSKELKAIAKNDFNVPLLAVASLNRGAEARTNKRPTMADLRESGQIESDADVVAMIYRDDYYNPESKAQAIAEVDFLKQRNGPTGKIELVFLKNIVKFEGKYQIAEPEPQPEQIAFDEPDEPCPF